MYIVPSDCIIAQVTDADALCKLVARDTIIVLARVPIIWQQIQVRVSIEVFMMYRSKDNPTIVNFLFLLFRRKS